MPNLTIAEWLLVVATISGPVLAVQAQKWVERINKRRERQLGLFYTLMSSRGAPLSVHHVTALNMIELELYGQRVFGVRSQSNVEKRVMEAWHSYYNHLHRFGGVRIPPDQLAAWLQRKADLLTELLFEMSKALGYNFEKSDLDRLYSPVAHSDMELADQQIKSGVLDIVTGRRSLSVVVADNEAQGPNGLRRA